MGEQQTRRSERTSRNRISARAIGDFVMRHPTVKVLALSFLLMIGLKLIADGVVHIVGVGFGLVAATALIVLTAVYATAVDIAAVSVYVAGLLAMLVLSATYNLWPVSRAKWVLRRFDHSAIYLLIAGTYTPFLAQLDDTATARLMLAVVWGDRRHRAEDRTARPVRPAGDRALSRHGLERHDAL